ncbi:NRPS [Purpureocillium takamizusanense]|uniref:NRPS n=1 Tax=Purpureocillium takamizusanense TaxID=2060973 RepID=A0A9Q8QE58_9HYPO|nr:NRPS [Purpureocillium takamizusanense]UNI17970.1 NRPS [Purpureocillium takamizusanense]
MTDSDRLSILNANPKKVPGPQLLHHLVAPPSDSQAVEHLAHGQRISFTYRRFHGSAECIAKRITNELTLGEGSEGELVVPLLIRQCPLLYISQLAILKVGGAFCPLNLDAPPERIKFILKDVSASVILTTADLAPKIPVDAGVRIIQVDDIDITSNSGAAKLREPGPDDLAYVMYTSGSTGTPKGVGISHSAATQALLAHNRHVPHFSRFLQFAAPTFDVSVFEIFFPLFRGSTLISVHREEMLDDLPRILRHMNVDACELTPSVAGSLLRTRDQAPGLKLLLTIGEMLNARVVGEFGGGPSRNSILWAMYGPTEATIHCTLQPALPSSSNTGNIGSPLETVSCFVIEPGTTAAGDSFKILPVGEAGELAVGGHQLAREYLNRPEQTASAFISTHYGRLYRTGDRARITAEGTLECLGRLSSGQVKLRGQRIELGEIEQVTLKTQGCHGAVAAVVDSNLVVFCAVDESVAEDAVMANCEEWLPRFMVPSEVVLMSEFPRLPSGKVDTRKLKSDYSHQKSEEMDAEFVEELSARDQAIVRGVSETLELKATRRTELSSAGLDSLKAIRLASYLRAEGLEVTATNVLRQRTVADICATVRERKDTGANGREDSHLSLLHKVDEIRDAIPALHARETQIETVSYCTPLQSAMLAETAQNQHAYCNHIKLQAAPQLIAEDLVAAITQVASANEILRTGFTLWNGQHLAVLFKQFPQDNVRVVSAFDADFGFTAPEDFLKPFRVQIKCSTQGTPHDVLIQAHHAIYDGWSLDTILSDITALLSQTTIAPRPQFREVAQYYVSDDIKDTNDAARSFWSEHLLGWNKTPFPRLVTRHSSRNEIETMHVTSNLSRDIVRRVGQEVGVSPHVLFQGALALVWAGIVGEQDVILGTVTSGRTIPIEGIEKVIGPCLASLPLRVNFSGIADVSVLLKSIHATNHAIMEHCTLPLAHIRKIAGLRPAESLYDVLFVYQESPATQDADKLLVKPTSHLDRIETTLLIELEPRDDTFVLQATFHSMYIPSNFVEHLLGQLQSFAHNMVNDINAPLNKIIGNFDGGLSLYNPGPRLFEGVPDLATGFEKIAASIPSADALSFSTSLNSTVPQTLSFRDLNATANQVAHFLINSGAQIGQVVAIIMDKSPMLYCSLLGIVKAGCAYLPVLPTTPLARIVEIFRQGRITLCLADDSTLRALGRMHDVKLLSTDDVRMGLFSRENLEIPADASRLAYVIYTSGTTGTPKGVAVTQGNIVSNITHLRSTYPVTSAKQPRFLQACSQAFDVSVFEIFFAWHAGMCLCSATNDVLFEDLESSIRRMDITHLSLTPTVSSLIDPTNVPSVEFLVTAGEPMTQFVLDRWGDKLWQGYGPSETTNICSVKRMDRDDHIDHLGWVFPNTSVFVIAPSELRPVPVGWVGEFCFGGDQVAQGYLNDSHLTGERFIIHPEYGRIYRSGDLGRMLPDGSLVILGRLDDQLKLRGQRIEAGEVNSIVTSTGIAQAAVTVSIRRGPGSSKQLACFYVNRKSPLAFTALDVDPETNRVLFGSLQSKVPAYMVPSYLIPVSQVPLTSSGKVDRRRLLASFEGLSQDYLESASCIVHDPAHDSDWNATEVTIAAVIAKQRNVSAADVGRWTPFAALGVDSITAIDLARALSATLDRRVAISTILQNPSVAQLARSMDERSEALSSNVGQLSFDDVCAQIAADARNFVFQDPDNIETTLPCTPLQEAMLSKGQGSYCNKILLRLRIPSGDMRSYWNVMTQRHGILRTCFVTTSNAAFPIAQVVLRHWKIDWRTYNVHEPSLAGAAHEHLKALPEPIDSGAPPVSFAFIQYRGSTFLSIICHHALYDGVAMGNLWEEVECLAQGWTLPPPVPYKPFIQQALSLPDGVDDFWAGQFRSFQPSILFQRRSNADINQCTHSISLDMPFIEVQGRLKAIGASLLSACQAAWVNVLSIACDTPDVAFGNVVSGRMLDLEGLERLVAPCFNTVPMRKDMSRSAQNIDIVRFFQSLNTEMIRYQFTSLRHVHRLANCQRRGLFDTLLLLQQPLREMNERVWTLEEDSGDMDVPLVCEVVPCPNLNSVVVNVHYDMGLVPGDAATTMADIFKHVFRCILELPNASPLDRKSSPRHLTSGLKDLVPKREKLDESTHQQVDEGHWTQTESQIRKVISELSKVPLANVARSTTIFQVGLDSINAVQIASALRQAGYKVSASDVIECSTCEKLARRLAHLSHQQAEASVPSFDLQKFSTDVVPQITKKLPNLGSVESILPCTPVQSAMLASSIQTRGHTYLNMLTYKLDNTIELSSIAAAWTAVEQIHPMLRTGFLPVSHSDISYAMIRHSPGSLASMIDSVIRGFDTERWKHLSRSNMLQNQHLPPWRVALVAAEGEILMHILMHHALYDASSLEEILSAVAEHLIGKTRIFPPVEPPLTELLSRSLNDQGTAQKFWESQAEAAVVNKFPLMTPLREETSVGPATHDRESCMDLKFLHEATQSLGISLQAAIEASWARVLASYLGESSVVFGVTMSGRTTDAMQSAPLPCITTMPVIASNTKSNHTLLSSMMQFNVELHKHQYAPLSLVQKWLGHPASPVFDTLVVYQTRAWGRTARRPWTLVKDDAMAEYAVSLEIEPAENGSVRLCLTFAPNILPDEQARILLQQFDATLKHLLCDPNGTEDHLHQIRPELFAVTPASVPHITAPVSFLHEFVEQGASLHPSRVALEFASGFESNTIARKSWSYLDFNVIGNRLANLLRKSSQSGDIIAIHFQKCPEAYFSILGILKAGCSFVALDPNAPKARKEFILRDSRASCLLTDSNTMLDFDVTTRLVRIDEQSLQNYSDKGPQLGGGISPNNTCYCLYTSGTTGTPKGCEITHENAVQAMMAFQHLFEGHWEESSRWLQFAALHFDVSVLEQYWSWSTGITVVAAPRDLILDDLTGSIHRLGITHIDLTPSLARLTHPDDVPNLCRGVFITGGESLKQEILDAWGSKAVIYNAYGPTEATIGVTTYPRVPVNGRPSNIGRQFLNVGSYVFQPGTEIPVLRGGVGELCVSGKLVGKGYLHRPDLTAERFPTLSGFGGERIYRTGDLVRILHDGCFDFLGRADDQVKLRGQRLEIGEINHAIRTGAPEVKDVATIVVRQESGGKDVLVSFVVGDAEPATANLAVLPDPDGVASKAREACIERLPGYMVPTYFLRLPYIPLSPNNKVEAKALKTVFASLSQEDLIQFSAAAMASSHGQVDQKVLGRLSQALGNFSNVSKDSICASTSIFDLGVDSISALQLSTQLKSEGFPGASPIVLLRSPVVADLVKALSKKQSASVESGAIRAAKQAIQACNHRYRPLVCRELDVTAEDIEYIAPCSPLQQGIISKALTDESGSAYFNSFVLTVDESTSIPRVREAWERLVNANAILRTVFIETSNGYIQAAMKKSGISWESRIVETEEVGDIIQTARQSWIARNRDQILQPMHFTHIVEAGSHKVVLHLFHALYDGNSFDLMNQQASALYRDRPGQPGPSFIEALSYGPLGKYDHSEQFWVEHLSGWSWAPVTTESPPVEARPPIIATRTISLAQFEQLRARHNVTLQTVVLSLWVSVLQDYLGDKLTVGVIVSGRTIDLPGAERTIGPLFNTVPFFNKTLTGQTWAALIQHAHEFNTSVLDFPHVPLKSVQKWCSGGQALFDNLFAFQIEQPTLHNVAAPWTIANSVDQADYPLAMEVTRTVGGAMQCTLVAQSQVADDAVLEDLLIRMEAAAAKAQEDEFVAPDSVEAASCDVPHLEAQVASGVTHPEEEFQWSDQARLIQREMAKLADVPVEQISPSTTMLELGLDSIDVIKLSNRLKRGVTQISASWLMKKQTISRIVSDLPLDNGAPRPAVDAILQDIAPKLRMQVEQANIDMDDVECILPSTALQESMLAGMLESDFEWYFNHDVLEVADGVDMGRLRAAWEQVIAQSPVLRTGFIQVDDTSLDVAFCQVVFRKGAARVAFEDLSELSEIEAVKKAATKRAAESGLLSNLLQITFATVGKDRFVVLSLAHALYDGWSLGLLYQDLQAAYEGTPTLRPSPDLFLSKSSTSQSSRGRAFWSTYLDGVVPTVLDGQAQAMAIASPKLHRVETISRVLLSEVTAFCKKNSLSLQVVCFACWATVLAHRTRSLDVVFGLVLSGRDFDGAEDLLFPTMNTVAMRCLLHGSVTDFLKYVEESMTDIRDYQTFPLRKAQAAAKVTATEMFNSLFLLQKAPEQDPSEPKLLKSVDGASAVDYPVCIEAEAITGRLCWRTACQSKFFTEGDAHDLIEDLDSALQFFCGSPKADLLQFRGHEVSICGMIPVTINENAFTLSSQETDQNVDEKHNSATSLLIRETLSQVSGVPEESIKPSSTIYHLGLDSISSIKLSVLLRKRGITLRPRDLATASSIRELAKMATITEENAGAVGRKNEAWVPPDDLNVDRLVSESGISMSDVERILPATPLQVYMLTAWSKSGGSVFYPDFCYRIGGVAERAQFHRAWDALVAVTPILRTRFIATGSKDLPFMQVVASADALQSKRVTQPLSRIFVEGGQSDGVMTFRLAIHHSLYDGVSLPAIVAQLVSLLNDDGKAAAVEPDIAPWASFAALPLTERSRNDRKAFWTAYLRDTAVEVAPPPGTVSSITDCRTRTAFFDDTAMTDTSELQLLAARHGISLQALFLAAYARSIHTGLSAAVTSVVFGIYLANRTGETDAPSTLFPTLNLVPLRVRLNPETDLLEVAKAVQEDIHSVSSLERPDVGLWEIYEWTGVRVHSFVNFLSLPGGDVTAPLLSPVPCMEKVALTPLEETADISTTERRFDSSTLLNEPWLQRNAVADAYPMSIDVEAALQPNGGLAIGVFGPRELLSGDAATQLAGSVAALLREAANDG